MPRWKYAYEKQRQFREITGKNINEFARLAGVMPYTIRRIEKGETPTVKTYLSIINAYGLEAGIFFDKILS